MLSLAFSIRPVEAPVAYTSLHQTRSSDRLQLYLYSPGMPSGYEVPPNFTLPFLSHSSVIRNKFVKGNRSIQRDSERDVSILGGDSNSNCEEKVHLEMFLVLLINQLNAQILLL